MNTQKELATPSSVAINMRVDSNKRNLIDMAANLLGNDRTSFIMDAACRYAEQVIQDKRLFLLNDSAFDAFEQALQANRMEHNECLVSLLSRPKRWA